MRRWIAPILTMALFGLAALRLSARPERAAAEAEEGIASLYPGDKGIEKDPAVVFFEDFEAGDVSGLVGPGRWTSWSNKDDKVMSFVTDSVPGSSGKRSLSMTATKSQNEGGYLYKTLDPGYDQLYARFYVRFAADAPYVHHFVQLGSEVNAPPWPMGFAGSRPNGSDHFTTALDLVTNNFKAAPPGCWMLYSYWPEMHSFENPDGSGNKFYGNVFGPVEPMQAPRDKWICLELMIKCNSAPDRRDGEEAFWVDGRLVDRWAAGTHIGTWFRDKFHLDGDLNTDPKPFEGFMWRRTGALKINYLWLQYYLASVFQKDMRPADRSIPYNGEIGRVRFDNVVLATRYIGPLKAVRGKR